MRLASDGLTCKIQLSRPNAKRRTGSVHNKKTPTMKTYLLTWNPNNWAWETLKDDIKQLENLGVFRDSWSCGNKKNTIKTGDRVFLMHLGVEPKGIVASGYTTSDIYQDTHWDKTKSALANYVKIDFDVILNPKEQDILSADFLIANKPFSDFSDWFPRSSGNNIEDNIASELEKAWFSHLNKKQYFSNYYIGDNDSKQILEGNKIETVTTRYERNPHARQLCLKIHGYSCAICDFNFEKQYGLLGKDFIHVHHVNPLSEVDKIHELNPKIDLIPVCPNCHSMIHIKRPALKIDELRQLIKDKK